MNARLFAALPKGAALVNVGRGGHLDQAALVESLDAGHLSHAVLDVSDPEPLPAADPMWRHPAITLTPHIASMTRPESAAEVVIANLRRDARGEPMHGLIDRNEGY